MWVYFNSEGNVSTRIPHGEIIRQQGTFDLFLAFEPSFFSFATNQELYEYLRNYSIPTICFKKTLEKKFNISYYLDRNSVSIERFKKITTSEITYDFVDGQQYVVIHFHAPTELTADFGSYDSIVTFYESVEQREQEVENVKKTGVIKYYVEKTYGKDLPNTYINPSQYDYLLSVIGDKIGISDYDIYDVGAFSNIKDIANAILAHKNIKDGSYIYKAKLEDTNMGFSKDAIAIAGYDNYYDSRSFRTIILCDNQISVYGGLDNEQIEMLTIPQLLTRKIKVTESIEVPTPTSDTNAVNKKYLEKIKTFVKFSNFPDGKDMSPMYERQHYVGYFAGINDTTDYTKYAWSKIADADEDLSPNSTNPIQNKTVYEAIMSIEAAQNLLDIVSSKQDLDTYDKTLLKVNDKIKVLVDETRNDAGTYYKWNGNSWNYIGKDGNYFTQAEVLEIKNNLQSEIKSLQNLVKTLTLSSVSYKEEE